MVVHKTDEDRERVDSQQFENGYPHVNKGIQTPGGQCMDPLRLHIIQATSSHRLYIAALTHIKLRWNAQLPGDISCLQSLLDFLELGLRGRASFGRPPLSLFQYAVQWRSMTVISSRYICAGIQQRFDCVQPTVRGGKMKWG